MDTKSLWEVISVRETNYPELNKELDVDVAIIGGGITGITAANQLINQGKKVAIVEAELIGGVTTSFSTGNLYVTVQPFYQNIYSKFNLEIATAVAQSRQNAINYIEENVKTHDINCQFSRRPWYAYTAKDERISINKEVELFKKMGFAIDYIKDLPLPFKFNKAIVMENQARFNPLQYVIAMAEVVNKKGCEIFEKSRVLDLQEKNDKCFLKTKNGKITAKKVFMATHTPIGVNATQFYTAPYRSYVVAVKIAGDYPEGHFWDLDRPPHATCTHATQGNTPDLLMVAGSHHKTGQGNNMVEHYQELEKFLRDHFSVIEIAYRWSAQHYQSADKIPYIGLAHRTSKHIYMATGYWADGLVYGTIAGIVIGDVISENKNQFTDVYYANRFKPIASAPFLMHEGVNILLQYMKDYPMFSKKNFDEVKPGEGKVYEINQEKLAVSRDKENKLHVVSAICTHMKCLVNWNNAEKTWDCPCHGSRFTCEGKVIEGPAQEDLAQKKGI